MFISPSIKHVSLDMSSHNIESGLAHTISTLSAATELQLDSLHIGTLYYQQEMNEDLGRLLATQPRLNSLVLTYFSATPVIQQIATLHNLRELRISLEVAKAEIGDRFGALADGCPLLQHLVLKASHPRSSGNPKVNYMMTFDPIERLLPLKHLEILEVSWIPGFDILPSDVERMGAAWRNLEWFLLRSNDSRHPLSLLSTFAKSFPPSLRYLGASFRVENRGIPTVPEDVQTFTGLKKLELGICWVQPEEMVGLGDFLARLCRPGTRVCSAQEQEIKESIRSARRAGGGKRKKREVVEV